MGKYLMTGGQNRRKKLQRKLKQLTQTSDWLGDPKARAAVNELRSELFPRSFSMHGDVTGDLQGTPGNKLRTK